MYIRVHTVPRARREEVNKEADTVYRISVREPAERNLANRRIQEILARELRVPIRSVHLVTGHRSPTKMYTIEEEK